MIWGIVILAVLTAAAGADRWIRRHRRLASSRQATAGWARDVYEDPTEGFDAPPPTEAYAAAPEIGDELLALLQHQDQQAADPDAADNQVREQLLRQAAVRDRLAIDSRHQDGEDTALAHAAIHAAWALQDHDHLHGDWAGPHSPTSIEWDPAGGGRAYVRQEYAAWLAAYQR